MMKKRIAALLTLAMLTMPAALAATEEEARSAAQELVGTEATLLESERDDGFYEFEFKDADCRYEVIVNAESGQVFKLEKSYPAVKKSAGVVLDEAAARTAAAAVAAEELQSYALLEQEGDNSEWKIFYNDGTTFGMCDIQAETGEIRSVEIYYNLPEGLLDASRAEELLTDAWGDVAVDELEMDFDAEHDSYRYEGKATHDGKRYEFEISALTGEILEWERD